MDMSELASKLQHVQFTSSGHTSTDEDMLVGALEKCSAAMRQSLENNPEKAAVFGGTEEAVAEIAVTALLTHELSVRKMGDLAFDTGHMTSFQPGTGPDIRYWYARLCLLLQPVPNGEEFAALKISSHGRQDSGLGGSGLERTAGVIEDEVTLLRLLVQYPDVVQTTYSTLEPATLVAFLVIMAHQTSLCVVNLQGGGDLTSDQTKLYEATKVVLKNGMGLLGLAASVN